MNRDSLKETLWDVKKGQFRRICCTIFIDFVDFLSTKNSLKLIINFCTYSFKLHVQIEVGDCENVVELTLLAVIG